MTCQIIHLSEQPEFIGRAVCAMGVFDGVHQGHATLVQEAARIARSRNTEAFVVTFDRDPDQVVTPETAAPQLLTWEDKATFLCAAGADRVLVVPFTERTAALGAEEFLSDILLAAVDPVALVVGADFRFGRHALGTVETLRRWCEPRKIGVEARTLVAVNGIPVTSTRIRQLVAAGDVESAAELLGRPHRVAGIVVHGRGEGTALGVATANVSPVQFAALPADGVYAGRALVGLSSWPAAVSVGVPPTFPDATDVLEAHVIGFEGDLYDELVTIEFLARIREQRAFQTTEDLMDAIRTDIATATDLAASWARTYEPENVASEPSAHEDWDPNAVTALVDRVWDAITFMADDEEPEYLPDGSLVVEDPAALEAAERTVAEIEPADAYQDFDSSWVEVLGPVTLINATAQFRAFEITSPLMAEAIPFAWDPMPPQELTTVRPELASALRFRLFVPPQHAARARELLDWWDGGPPA